MVRRYFGIHAFSPEPGSLGSVAAFNNRSASAIASSRFLPSGNIIGLLSQNIRFIWVSPVFFSVAFVSSRRISFIDALPRWEFECKLSSSFRRSASAAADVIAGPTRRGGLCVFPPTPGGPPPGGAGGKGEKIFFPFGGLPPPFYAKALTV